MSADVNHNAKSHCRYQDNSSRHWDDFGAMIDSSLHEVHGIGLVARYRYIAILR